MKDLVWGEGLRVGVDEIDEDHRRLVELFNMLSHSVAEGDAPEYLAAVLNELVNCTVWHFSHEERLMLKYGYEGFEDHKMEHEELIRNVRKLQHLVEADKLVTADDIVFLEKWLTGHILSTDTDLAAFLTGVL